MKKISVKHVGDRECLRFFISYRKVLKETVGFLALNVLI